MKDARWPTVAAPFALPVGSTLLLVVAAVAAQSHGRLSALAVTLLCGFVVAGISAMSDPIAALPLGAIGWLTATSFGQSPYGELHPGSHRAAVAAVTLATSAAAGLMAGSLGRMTTSARHGVTLINMSRLSVLASAVDRRRQLWALALGAVVLPSLTAVLAAARDSLNLGDDLLFFLLAVVAVAIVGGFWPAIVAATAASLLVNWYFTEPFHTFTIAQPDNLLALLLFVLVAITVSSVVHLAARRSQQASRSRVEAEALLQLARSVLGEDDTPAGILRHLHDANGLGLQLLERVGQEWAPLASVGDLTRVPTTHMSVRSDLLLVVHGSLTRHDRQLLEAGSGQAAAALDRDRLRTRAAQSEALAAGNRMRTALLAAVSHDLRTPLASIKAGISSLRQTDVSWGPDDEAELLEDIEESTDRLGALIGNLLDMSRLQTGAVQPFVQGTSVEEISALALRSVPGGSSVRVDVPEDLPLVQTDAGLLERAIANLVSNATRYAAGGQSPELVAHVDGDGLAIEVVDHGPGVAPADRDRIFEPFQRLGDHDMTTGVGLGLAVARGFVEAVGGTLTAAETPGGGLTMTVRLPVLPRQVVDA
jgi:two-component system sensor histidine kinase KdpD